MASSVKQMLEAANAAVPKVTAAQAREVIAHGNAARRRRARRTGSCRKRLSKLIDPVRPQPNDRVLSGAVPEVNR